MNKIFLTLFCVVMMSCQMKSMVEEEPSPEWSSFPEMVEVLLGDSFTVEWDSDCEEGTSFSIYAVDYSSLNGAHTLIAITQDPKLTVEYLPAGIYEIWVCIADTHHSSIDSTALPGPWIVKVTE